MIALGLVSGGVGGGQRIALAVAGRLRDLGHDVLAVSPTDGPVLDQFRDVGGDVLVVGPMRSVDPVASRRIADAFRRRSVSVTYTHSVVGHEIVLGRAARSCGSRLVVHRHIAAHFSPRPARGAVQRRLWRSMLRRADAVVSVSREVDEQVRAIAGRSTTIVPNGVPIVGPGRARPLPATPTVAFIGRLDRVKRPADFVRMAALVAEAQPGTRFLVVGSSIDEHERELAHLAVELGLAPPVLELVSGAEGRSVIPDVDVLVLPSELEGHPLVVLEAMVAGAAVVASDIPAHRDTIDDGVDGVLVPVGDVPALADAVASLLRSSEHREALVTAARRRAETAYDERRMVDELVPLVLGTAPAERS